MHAVRMSLIWTQKFHTLTRQALSISGTRTMSGSLHNKRFPRGPYGPRWSRLRLYFPRLVCLYSSQFSNFLTYHNLKLNHIVYTELGTTWVRTCPWEGGWANRPASESTKLPVLMGRKIRVLFQAREIHSLSHDCACLNGLIWSRFCRYGSRKVYTCIWISLHPLGDYVHGT